MAVHRAATRYPKKTAALLRVGLGSDVTKIGSGYISDVYKIGEGVVVKAHKDSVSLSRRERRCLADSMIEEHQNLVEYVGPAVLPHSIDIGPHPEHRFLQAVRITQQYVEVDYLKLNEEEEGISALAGRIGQVQATYPEFIDELGDVIMGSRALYASHQLSTDILGANNLGIHKGHLTIVDAQPVNATYPHAQAAISTYFDNLDVAMQQVVAKMA